MISAEIMGVSLELMTMPGIFSPRAVDAGTLAMLGQVAFSPGDRVLDLGCGCGVVGILAAKLIGADNVVMSDIDPAAVALSRQNAGLNGVPGVKIVESDAFAGIDDTGFTLILSNPPYNSDFSVAKRFVEKGFNRLAPGGKMVMVTRRLDWYKNKLKAIFGGVKVVEDGGYYVFTAEKRSMSYAKRK